MRKFIGVIKYIVIYNNQLKKYDTLKEATNYYNLITNQNKKIVALMADNTQKAIKQNN